MQARINDTEINFEIDGPEGAPVVTFSHSLAASLDMWEFQLAAMKDSYRVLCFDTRGHGKSSIPPGPHTMEMFSADVVGLLDYLDIQRTHFVGLSMGGMIAQVLAGAFTISYNGNMERNCEQVSTDYFGDILKKFGLILKRLD